MQAFANSLELSDAIDEVEVHEESRGPSGEEDESERSSGECSISGNLEDCISRSLSCTSIDVP